MTLLSPHELADCVLQAGFSKAIIQPDLQDNDAVVMVAICLGESAARTYRGAGTEIMGRSNTGLNIGNWDHGVAQISGKFHADKIRAEGGNWRDPYANLRIAKRIFDDAGKTFNPWHIFTSGAYKDTLPDARIGVKFPWPCPTLDWIRRAT